MYPNAWCNVNPNIYIYILHYILLCSSMVTSQFLNHAELKMWTLLTWILVQRIMTSNTAYNPRESICTCLLWLIWGLSKAVQHFSSGEKDSLSICLLNPRMQNFNCTGKSSRNSLQFCLLQVSHMISNVQHIYCISEHHLMPLVTRSGGCTLISS